MFPSSNLDITSVSIISSARVHVRLLLRFLPGGCLSLRFACHVVKYICSADDPDYLPTGFNGGCAVLRVSLEPQIQWHLPVASRRLTAERVLQSVDSNYTYKYCSGPLRLDRVASCLGIRSVLDSAQNPTHRCGTSSAAHVHLFDENPVVLRRRPSKPRERIVR